MADETQDVPAEGTEETERSAPAGAPTLMGRDPASMRSLLSRPSDVAARPGFRAPSNKKSKAQKKKKGKGRKRR